MRLQLAVGLALVVVAPAALPSHAECQTMTKGFSVRLDVFGPKVTPAQVKPLLEKVVSRLPS